MEKKLLCPLRIQVLGYLLIYFQLFTKFATKSESGTGLGLYISKKIIEAHGGRIWADNNPGSKGATFAFTLPQLIN
ncbi:MAG: ATP-binding protein [Thermoproteota archaeon]|nr:ATP-binding protein [Thermoproteota archaeon]